MKLEHTIKAIEKRLNISITVIDNQGVFHTPAGIAVFDYDRQSHKKNKICRIGFCEKCIQHCRYEVNEKLKDAEPAPLIETCWKGITEIVVPFNVRGKHLGMLYAGSWRQAGQIPANGLPAEFYPEFDHLPVWNEVNGKQMLLILDIAVKGMLNELERFRDFSYLASSRARAIAGFIHDRAATSVSLTDLAEFLSLSRSRTSYLLNKYFHQSFSDLLNQERIRRARTLLVSTDYTLADIAEKTGYSDEYHFNKVFRKIVGAPPGLFRDEFLR